MQDAPASAEPSPQPGAQVVYRAEFDARLDEVSRVCAEVAALAAARVGDIGAGEIDLGLAEALSNIARHGYPPGEPDPVVQLVCLEAADRWCLRIFDRGRPIPQELLQVPEHSPFDFDPERLDELPEGGMGLALLQASFDHVDYRAGARGNLLVLTKLFERAPSGT